MDSLVGPTQWHEVYLPQVLEPAPPRTLVEGPNNYGTAGSAELDSLLNSSINPTHNANITAPSAIPLSYIIAGNCLCSGVICLCFWGFSKIDDLTRWETRTFNALSLLLSAALGFGIGFLYDRIGLFARGTLLQSRAHSVEEVCINVRSIH